MSFSLFFFCFVLHCTNLQKHPKSDSGKLDRPGMYVLGDEEVCFVEKILEGKSGPSFFLYFLKLL